MSNLEATAYQKHWLVNYLCYAEKYKRICKCLILSSNQCYEAQIHQILSAATKSLQSCPTVCYPIDGSPPGSPVPGILQARTLEWVAIYFSNAWKWKVKVKSLSHAWVLATPWTAAYQAPPSMRFSRQEYWSGLPLPSLLFSLLLAKYSLSTQNDRHKAEDSKEVIAI